MTAPPARAAPSPEAIAECDEFVLDELYRDFGLIQSIATSGLEAARRGDRAEIKLRLRVQLRDCFHHAVEVHNLLSTEPPKKRVGR
jgi:hypothetical protein